MSSTRFRVNLHSVVAWMSRLPCSKQARYMKFKWIVLLWKYSRSNIAQASSFCYVSKLLNSYFNENVVRQRVLDKHLLGEILASVSILRILKTKLCHGPSNQKLIIFPWNHYVLFLFNLFFNYYPSGNKTLWRRRNEVSLYVPVTSQLRLKWNT